MTRTALSVRTLGVGAVLGALLAAASVYSTSRTGSPIIGNLPAAVVGFALLSLGRGGRPSSHEVNLVQTVASSAAVMALTGGFVGPLTALVLAGHPPPLIASTLWAITLGVVACLIAIPLRSIFVVRGGLAFPSGVATAEILEAMQASSAAAARRVRVLAASAGLAAVVVLAHGVVGWPPALTVVPISVGPIAAGPILFGIGWSPLLAGVGFLVGARTGLAFVAGTAIAWLIVAPVVVANGIVVEPSYGSLMTWLLWPGVGLILGGAGAGLAAGWRRLGAGVRELGGPAHELRLTGGAGIALAIAAIALTVLGHVAFGVHPAITALALVVSIPLCAAAARAKGETDSEPAGAFGALGQAIAGTAAPGDLHAPLTGGGVVTGTVMQSAELLSNWKTGLVVGAPPRPQLVAALVGVVVGAVASAGAFELIQRGFGLGTEAMPAPAGVSWKATAEVVQHGLSAMPPYSPLAAGLGLLTGAVLVLARRRWLPSPVVLGLTFIIPPYVSLTIGLGGLGLWLLSRRRAAWCRDHATSLASGAIAGEAIAGLIVAALVIAGLTSA